MRINSRNLKSKLDKCDQRSEGCDYLQLSISKELLFERFFYLLDNDNSSIAHVEGEDYLYTLSIDFSKKHKTILVSVSVDDISYPIIKVSHFRKGGGCIDLNYSVHILGTAFRLIELGEIESLDTIIKEVFYEDIDTISNASITRIDYKLDMFYKDKTLIPPHRYLIDTRKGTSKTNYTMRKEDIMLHDATVSKIQNGSEITYYQTREDCKDNVCNGWSIGKRNTKTIRVRCYEKLIDTVAKGKFGLYDDYFQFKNVYRLEGEFRNYFCRNEDGTFVKLKELQCLVDKCRSRFGMGEYKSIYLYRPHALSMKSSDCIKRYVKNFQNRGYKIYENNMNSIHLHIEGLYERGVDPGMIGSLLEEQRNWLDSILNLKTGYS